VRLWDPRTHQSVNTLYAHKSQIFKVRCRSVFQPAVAQGCMLKQKWGGPAFPPPTRAGGVQSERAVAGERRPGLAHQAVGPAHVGQGAHDDARAPAGGQLGGVAPRA
jgi:hypothetical protein